jgi:hypothetical protein
MADMTWKILLTEDATGGGDSPGGTPGAGDSASQKTQKAAEDSAAEAKKNAPVWANIGKLVGSLAAVGGVIAFVFQMMRRSKVFSTFMDTLLTELSAIIDILFMPLVPLLVPLLTILTNFFQPLQTASKDTTKIMQDVITNNWSAVGDDILAAMKDFPTELEQFFEATFKSIPGLLAAAAVLAPIGVAIIAGIFFAQFAYQLGATFLTALLEALGISAAMTEAAAALGTGLAAALTGSFAMDEALAAPMMGALSGALGEAIAGGAVPAEAAAAAGTGLGGALVAAFQVVVVAGLMVAVGLALVKISQNATFQNWLSEITGGVAGQQSDGSDPTLDALTRGMTTAQWNEWVGNYQRTHPGQSINGSPGKVDVLQSTPSFNTPGHAVGTDYVPQTGLALLHKGEAVIPAAENAVGGRNRSRGGVTIQNIITVSGNSPMLPYQVADTIGNQIKFNKLRIM